MTHSISMIASCHCTDNQYDIRQVTPSYNDCSHPWTAARLKAIVHILGQVLCQHIA